MLDAIRDPEVDKLPDAIRADLEAATGRSLDHVRVHADARGQATAAAHGARAVTIGRDIYFAAGQLEPTTADGRELIAHEVAHVAQTGPIQASARERATIEAAELEADHFAARFRERGGAMTWVPSVAVASTQPMCAPAAGASREAVEREDRRVAQTNKKAWLGQHLDAAHYFELHRDAFLTALRVRLATTELATGNAQLHWHDGQARFVEYLSCQLTGPEIDGWPGLLHPNDPWRLIDSYRVMDSVDPQLERPSPTTGAMGWITPLGIALAGSIEAAIRKSLGRIGTRYVTAAGRGDHVTPDELVASHPMDRVVAEVLCMAGMVAVDHAKRAPLPIGYDVQANGARVVSDIEWLGARDRALWNWIRVNEPRDATVEEVAMTLWGKTDYAYGLTVAFPCIAIPQQWARQLPAKAYAPDFAIAGADSAQALANTVLVDEVALAQGEHARERADATRPRAPHTPVPPDRANLIDTLEASHDIVEELARRLDPFAIGGTSAARTFVQRKRAWLVSASPDDAKKWTPVIIAQHDILRDVAVGVGKSIQLLARAGIRDQDVQLGGDKDPGRRLLARYAAVAGTSMFVESARAALSTCAAMQASLPIALLARMNVEAERELGTIRGAEAQHPTSARSDAKELVPEQADVAEQLAALQAQMLAGHAPDAQLFEATAIATASLNLRAQLASLHHTLASLRDAIAAGDEGYTAKVGNAPVFQQIVLVSNEIDGAIEDLLAVDGKLAHSSPAAVNAKYDAMPASDGREVARAFELGEGRRAHLQAAQQEFATVVRERGLDGRLFDRAQRVVEGEQRRKLVVDIGAMIAIAVVSAGVASAAGEFAGSALGGLRTARVVGGITDLVVSSAGQTALVGGSFAHNLLGNAAVVTALAPLHAVAESWGVGHEQVVAAWQRQGKTWKVVLAKGTALTADLIASAAVNYATQRALAAKGEVPDEMALADWAAQGATMILGEYVQAKLVTSMERLRVAGRSAGGLVARIKRQMTLADAVAKSANAQQGRALFEQHDRLIGEELAFWQALEQDQAARSKLGITYEQVDERLHGARGECDELHGETFRGVQLRLAGLEQEVPGGRLWVGDPDAIVGALAELQNSGTTVEIEEHDLETRRWRVELNGEEVVIRERVAAARDHEHAGRVDEDRASAEQRTEELGPGSLECTASAVPGSEFKGKGEHAGDPHTLLAAANRALVEIAAAERGIVRAEHAHVSAEMRPADREIAANTHVVHLESGANITIRVSVAPLAGQNVARSVMNPTKEGVTAVERPSPDGSTPVKVEEAIKGRYVIQISEHLDAVNVRRAVAHEVAEILARRALGTRLPGADVLRPGGDQSAPLSPHDRGRLAEIEDVAREIGRGGACGERAGHELMALVEDLGLRDGTAGADERYGRVAAELGAPAREALQKARTRESALPEAEARRLAWLREEAQVDREAQRKFDEAHAPRHEVPTTGIRGRIATESERIALARQARAKRDAMSAKTLADVRRANAAGQHPKLQIQIGGNAALAARDPRALLVDANERWATDASAALAQTAQQMEGVKAAGIGDPYEFAAANERVPLDAIRFWQDEIAAQGPVIDGRAELGVTQDGTLIATIRPNDGSASVVVEIDGVPLVATGFTKENAPGVPRHVKRGIMSPRQALIEIDNALAPLEQDPVIGARASEARHELAKLHGFDEAQAGVAICAIAGDVRAKLGESGPVRQALETLDAQRRWFELHARDPAHVLYGDEANRLTVDQLTHMKHVVIAGTGGTGVSAAENLLRMNPTVRVSMIGYEANSGLIENDQFREVVQRHGTIELCRRFHFRPEPGIDGRFEFHDGYDLGAVRQVDGAYDVNATAANRNGSELSAETTRGDTYVLAMGRYDDLPPAIVAIANQAERHGLSVRKEALFDDGLYAGYAVIIEQPGGKELRVDVTGAASRFADKRRMSDQHAKRVQNAVGYDAPPEGGNFAGGYAPSATQSARYVACRRTKGC
jgi:hypothetical protein